MGLQIGTQFCPGLSAVALAKADTPEKKLGFFCGPREAQAAGSLISTYRVVNTTLRAESEKTVAAVYDRRSGEFQLSSLSVELETVWRSTD